MPVYTQMLHFKQANLPFFIDFGKTMDVVNKIGINLLPVYLHTMFNYTY